MTLVVFKASGNHTDKEFYFVTWQGSYLHSQTSYLRVLIKLGMRKWEMGNEKWRNGFKNSLVPPAHPLLPACLLFYCPPACYLPVCLPCLPGINWNIRHLRYRPVAAWMFIQLTHERLPFWWAKGLGGHSVLRLYNVSERMSLYNTTLKVLIDSNRRVSLAVCMMSWVTRRTAGEFIS